MLPQAVRAMRALHRADTLTPTYPIAFLTNGGGVTEQKKAEQLSNWLEIDVAAEQIVLSHTPYRPLASSYANDPVLIIGRGTDIRTVAQHYGFNKTVTTAELARAMPTAVPFMSQQHYYQTTTPTSSSASSSSIVRGGAAATFEGLTFGTPHAPPIRAIFVFSDPSDWYIDLQLVLDVVLGKGTVGRRREDLDSDEPQIPVFFSNPDLLWANECAAPRFGQGAFAACVEALHEKVTGSGLPLKTVFGKPNPEPYRLIETLLTEQAIKLGLLPENWATTTSGEKRSSSSSHVSYSNNKRDAMKGGQMLLPPFSSIYAVGDNSAADVQGANAAGHPWVSILVRTGVFSGPQENCPDFPARIVVDDVEAAVAAAMHHSRSMKWHSMR